jgi:hypothetical protein
LRGHLRDTWEDDIASSNNQNTTTPNKRKALQSLFKKTVSTANTSGGSTSQKLFWPEEFLTHDIPEARVWTYRYNADVIGVFEANKNSLSQRGRDLAIKVER